jgi:hypothetical protein
VTLRALAAILCARLYAQRHVVLYACATALLVGFVQPHGAIGPILFCSLLGIAIALAQSPGRYPHLDYCEQSAPLFGRELARAKALVPCIAAGLAAIVYSLAQVVREGVAAEVTLLIVLAAVVASTLTALSATIRTSYSRAFYIMLAAGASAAAYALAIWANSILAELAFCAIVSFFALRQYGEALARYDPIL